MDFSSRYGPWAVIAGASEGIGASVARLLGERGVNVVLVSRRKGPLDDVAACISSGTRTVVADLSEPDAITHLAGETADLDVGLLVYNAGADPHASRFLDMPVEPWQQMVTRNCTTVINACHHFGGQMVKRGHGGIALVTSGAAWAGGSGLATYGATKAFDMLLAESLWAELGPLGIDVLAIILGLTDTPAQRRLMGGREVGGMADPDDVAKDMLDNLANGPTFPGGPSPFDTLPRRQAVELMTRATAGLQLMPASTESNIPQ